MSAAPLQPSVLCIDRLHNRYVVADHAVECVRNTCEAALASTLAEALALNLPSSLPPADTSLWFIPRLDLDFSVSTEIHHADVVDVWSKEIARTLVDALQSEDPGIVHFPDRATYLAHFLLDVIEQSAWDKWYYSSFEGLRLLPTSAVLRTAISDSPEIGLQALGLLSESQRCNLVRSLSPMDAQRTLSVLAASTLANDEKACLLLLSEVSKTALGMQSHEIDRRSLLLFLAVCERRPELAGKVLCSAAVTWSHLTRYLDEHATQAQEIAGIIRTGNLASLYAAVGADVAERISPLLRCPSEALDLLLPAPRETKASGDDRGPRFTAFGGAFLLFPILDDLPLQAIFDWPDLDRTSAAAIVRFVILAKCFGKPRALGCMRDPLIRDLLQIPPTITTAEIADWLARISPAQLHAFLRAVAAWHVDTGAVDVELCMLTSVAQKGRPLGLFLDCARGVWLHAQSLHNGRTNFACRLADFPAPKTLECHPSLWQTAQDAFPESQLRSLPADTAVPALARDVTYLALPRHIPVPRTADLALSVAAQGVLRCFAVKLPGFARSSLDYLYRNFLDCAAAVENAADQRVVTLARPPLHLVLAMAGLNRCRYHVDWLAGGNCAIFPEG